MGAGGKRLVLQWWDLRAEADPDKAARLAEAVGKYLNADVGLYGDVDAKRWLAALRDRPAPLPAGLLARNPLAWWQSSHG